MSLTPTDHAAALIADLMRGREVGKSARMWLLLGLLGYAGKPGARLDDCLGLAAPGRRHLNSVLQQLQRNKHLAQAVETISLDSDLSTWRRCERLALQVVNLVEVWNQHYRHVAQPTETWPAWKQHLFLAWRTGRKLPTSTKGLYEALTKSGHSR
jgi:hypothetical protein